MIESSLWCCKIPWDPPNEISLLWRAQTELLELTKDSLRSSYFVQYWFVGIFILPKVSSLKKLLSWTTMTAAKDEPSMELCKRTSARQSLPSQSPFAKFHWGFILCRIHFCPRKELFSLYQTGWSVESRVVMVGWNLSRNI